MRDLTFYISGGLTGPTLQYKLVRRLTFYPVHAALASVF